MIGRVGPADLSRVSQKERPENLTRSSRSEVSRGPRPKVNETLCKILCHNICCLIQSVYELKIEPLFWGAAEEREKAESVAALEVDEMVGAMAWV